MFMRIGFTNWHIIEKHFRRFVGSELKLIFHWKAHLNISFRLSFIELN